MSPLALAVSTSGDVYFVEDNDPYGLWKITGGAGAAVQIGPYSEVPGPKGLFITPEGDVYVADYGYSRVVKYTGGAGPYSVVGAFSEAMSVFVLEGDVYVCTSTLTNGVPSGGVYKQAGGLAAVQIITGVRCQSFFVVQNDDQSRDIYLSSWGNNVLNPGIFKFSNEGGEPVQLSTAVSSGIGVVC